VKFLVDAQLPPGLCVGLAARGHEAIHVADCLGGEAADAIIAEFAISQGCILMTKDDDFPFRHRADGLRIVWLRIGNASNRILANWLEARWPEVEAALVNGETLIEVQ
jgi:predicted nuclease of predicted toxin-antitoxin system